METADYPRLIRAADRHEFYAAYRQDIRPTTDDRPFFFHTTKLKNQFQSAFGRSMLFGNGLSALLTLLWISGVLVVLFVIGPLVFADRGTSRPHGWFAWLGYFGALGAVKYHADVVLGIYREEMYQMQRGVEGATEILVIKNRHGTTGFVDLYFYRDWMRFEDMIDADR